MSIRVSKPKKQPSPELIAKRAKREAKKIAKAARIAKALTPEAIKLAAKTRESRLRRTFNICSEEYEKVLEYQGGVCAITGRPAGTLALAVDHDHKTGLIRGLLSQQANKGLAIFQDRPDWLRAAADYMENPPMSIALDEEVYGVMGRMTNKAKSRKYGPLGTKTPQARKSDSLYMKNKTINKEPN